MLGRMRRGDRDAAAAFLTTYGSRIRRRIRGKLRPGMRRIFDSQEILSTVGRRLDLYVRAGRLQAQSADQLWALIFRMVDNAVVDKGRVYQRLQRAEDEDGPFAQELLRRLRWAEQAGGDDDVDIEIDRAVKLLPDRTDRDILSLWLVGTRHSEIATFVNLNPPAVRQRWRKIRCRLQRDLESERR
jgi:DNA-directed RNA polymerase specialized sigma24 family protein